MLLMRHVTGAIWLLALLPVVCCSHSLADSSSGGPGCGKWCSSWFMVCDMRAQEQSWGLGWELGLGRGP